MYMLIYLSIFASVAVADFFDDAPISETVDAKQLFEEFILTYRKYYATVEEKQIRLKIFTDNLRKLNQINAIGRRQGGTVFKPNYLADLSEEEFIQRFLGYDPYIGHHNCEEIDGFHIAGRAPPSFNWVDHNVVTDVKNQGQCGSCWAFATIANIESQFILKYGYPRIFSEQELIDCSNNNNNACQGGNAGRAMSDIMDLGGLELESDYPYEVANITYPKLYVKNCRLDPFKPKINIAGCSVYTLHNEEELKHLLLERGPVAVSINGINLHIPSYHNIILTKPYCPDTIDERSTKSTLHAVLLVGYGTTQYGQDYWLLKNSWGKDSGDKGYFRLSRGENTCGIVHKTERWSGQTIPTYVSTVHF